MEIDLKLPDLILLDEFNGDFEQYLNKVYSYFVDDFVNNKPVFRGTRLGLKKHPYIDGKEYTFYHMISSGIDESDRKPDLERMERIRWPKPIINNSNNNLLKVWKNKRGRDIRILIWFEIFEYLVILSERDGFLLPWTSYLVKEKNRKRKLLIEYQTFKKSQSRL